jgi:DNA-binding LacI/PurR family transcriptional regulator
VVSLFLTRGTPHNQKIMPLLTEFKVPLVGPSTGAMVLHEPVHPWLFNVRATYQREAERAVAHLALIGVQRIGIIHVKDSFGEDLLAGARRGFAGASLEPVPSSPSLRPCQTRRSHRRAGRTLKARQRRRRCCSSAPAPRWSTAIRRH